MLNRTQDIVDAAFTIAQINLRNNYHKQGIIAGNTHFSDIWTRDSCYASLGALEINDFDIVKTNLKTLLEYQHKNGQIPLRVGTKHFILKYLGFKAKTQPRYVEDKYISIPVDSNSLFMITLYRYLKKTNDLKFIQDNFDQIKKALDWNYTQDFDHDLLIEEGPYANWADSLRKTGNILYSNVLNFEATRVFGEICSLLQKKKLANHYLELSRNVNGKINQHFWNGTYYTDWLSPNKIQYFSSDGNLLAILFGLADQMKADKIQKSIEQFELDKDFCIGTNHPKYSFRHIYPLFHLISLKDYHNGLTWLWIGCLYAVAQQIRGDITSAENILINIAKKIVEFKGVYEVYHKNKPVRRLFYRSEKGFSWSSGMFIWACKIVGLK